MEDASSGRRVASGDTYIAVKVVANAGAEHVMLGVGYLESLDGAVFWDVHGCLGDVVRGVSESISFICCPDDQLAAARFYRTRDWYNGELNGWTP